MTQHKLRNPQLRTCAFLWRVGRYCLMAAGLCLLPSCTAPRGPLVITDPDPSIKIPAMEKAAREKDFKAIPQLIKELDNDDSAVRMYANQALEAITGVRTGYRYFQDDEHRQPSIALWREWQLKQADTKVSEDVTVTHTENSP